MENILTQKRCGKCGEHKPFSEFPKDKSRRDGYSTICKPCDREKNRKYYSSHSDEVLARQKRYLVEFEEQVRVRIKNWRKNNKDKIRRYVNKWFSKNTEKAKKKQKEWRDNNKKKISEKTKEWARANRDKRALTAEKRRISKINNGGTITAKEWEDLKEKYDNRCLCCKRTDVVLTMDHVIPISVGGKHSIDNIQPLCGSCNSSKRTKIIDYRPDNP